MTSGFYYLSIRDVELICFQVVKELMKFDEPLPDFSTRYPNKLESILSLPKSGFRDERLGAVSLNKT